MNDGRLNVSAGLAAYIKTVVNSEFAIREKGNDIPMYAYYAYKLVNPLDPNGTTILYNNKPINEVIKAMKTDITTLETNQYNFITTKTFSDGMTKKLDIEDYEKDMASNSENIKKVEDSMEYKYETLAGSVENKYEILEKNTTDKLASKLDTKTFEDYKKSVETTTNDYITSVELGVNNQYYDKLIKELTERVQALEDAAKGTEETT